MSGRRAALVAVLSLILAACSGGAEPAPSDPTGVATPDATSSLTKVTPEPTINVAGPSLAATSQPTPVPEPPKPSGVTFDERVRVSDDEAFAEITQTVTWRAPRTEGVEIRVYGVTECIAEPANPSPDTSGPCLVEHTPLPASVRRLLATAPASDGVVSWTWTEETGCNPGPFSGAYAAIVLAAYSASGHSIFAIAAPGRWWEPGPGEVVC